MNRVPFAIFMIVVFASFGNSADDRYAGPGCPWYEGNSRVGYKVCIYLFWHHDCQGCDDAKKFAQDLEKRRPWVKFVSFDLTKASNEDFYRSLAKNLGNDGTRCPAIVFCKQLKIGYVSYNETGKAIEEEMIRWHDLLAKKK